MNQSAKYLVWTVAALTLAWMLIRLTVGIESMAALRDVGMMGLRFETPETPEPTDTDTPDGQTKTHARRHTTIRVNVPKVVVDTDSVLVFGKVPKLDVDELKIELSELRDSLMGLTKLNDSIIGLTTRHLEELRSQIPQLGDTLLSFEGKRIALQTWKEELQKPRKVGTRVPMTIQHDGQIYNIEVPVKPIPAARRNMYWIFLGISTLVGFLYYGVGLFTIFKQGDSVQARVLALLNMSLGMLVYTVLPGTLQGLMGRAYTPPEWQTAILQGVGILTQFAMAYWLHLAFIFPFASPILKKRPWFAYLLCYLPTAIAVPASLLGIESDPGTLYGGLVSLAHFAMFIQFIAAVVILRRKRKRAATTLERRQLNAVFLGAMLGPVAFLIPIFVLIVGLATRGNFAEASQFPEMFAMSAVMFALCLAFLPIPFSFLYAFRKYRLMEVELRFRRGTRFALVTGGLLIVFFGILYGVTHLLLNTFELEGRTATLTVALVLALGFAPLQQRTRKVVERKFFPERNRLRAMLNQVLAASSAMPDRVALWDRLEEGLKQGLEIAAAIPVLHDERRAGFHLPNGDNVPIDPQGNLILELQDSGRPLFVDEALATGRVRFSAEEDQWLRAQRAVVLLPMVIHSRLIGFIALAFTQAHEDMSAEDLSILASVVSQVGLQSENLRLLEENVEKRRLQEQLEMARDVQQRFLPHVLPETPGIDVDVRFRSSLEVAGDYYDVLPLSGGRTLMAVGDVAGKGAGAAMIMANVQASFRSMARAGVPLGEMVTGINELLHANTSPDQFVTFFAAIYEASSKKLRYVNAGHNSPRLIRASGAVVPLDSNGLVLGVEPTESYGEHTAELQAGDVLVAFTDGVSEAMNALGEEFGEDRIVASCREDLNHSAAAYADCIEKKVAAFCGSQSYEDDFTLLVAKVI